MLLVDPGGDLAPARVLQSGSSTPSRWRFWIERGLAELTGMHDGARIRYRKDDHYSSASGLLS